MFTPFMYMYDDKHYDYNVMDGAKNFYTYLTLHYHNENLICIYTIKMHVTSDS